MANNAGYVKVELTPEQAAAKLARRQAGQVLVKQITDLVLGTPGVFEARIGSNGEYLTTGQLHLSPEQYDLEHDGILKRAKCQVQFCINLTGLKPLAQAEAATVENARSAMARLTPDQKRAEVERLMAELE